MLPTLRQISNEIIKDITGGRLSNIENINNSDADEKVNSAREKAIQIKYNKTRNARSINTSWYQTFNLTYDATIQDNPSAYVRFAIPSLVDTSLMRWGAKNAAQSFTISDVFRINNMVNSKYSYPRPNNMVGVVDGNSFKVYGNLLLQSCQIQGVFSIPSDIPVYTYNVNTGTYTSRAYNLEFDPYPIDGDTLELIKDQVKNELLLVMQQNLAAGRFPTVKADSIQQKPII